MPKINVDKNDTLRPLLTDTLPFETPICFSNDGFYQAMKEAKGSMPDLLRKKCESISSGDKITVPYFFRIKRTGLKIRTLAIPHPMKQLGVCNLYSEYADYISYLCNLSNFSLRKPVAVASVYYRREPISTDLEDDGTRTASTFFAYQRHRLIYQFYNSRRYVSLEKKYKHLRILDISKCFVSIYTHSICWAVKGKVASKHDANKYNFENQFDKIMQKMNNNETAGILIGPEFSRIFAEIILQAIDAEVESRLRSKKKYLSIHYEVSRYVDDYFIFSNEMATIDMVQKELQESLEEYRLHLNESKLGVFTSPFVSDITVAKEDLSIIFDQISSCIVASEDKVSITQRMGSSLSVISKLKTAVARNGANFYSLGGYIFFRLKKAVRKLSRKTLDSPQDVAYQFVEGLIDVSFFLYSMDVRVTTTFSIAKILIDLLEFCKSEFTQSQNKNIEKLIFDEAHTILRVEVEQKGTSMIEMVNLLIILRRLSSANKVPIELVRNLWKSLADERDFNYLSVMSLLLTCGDEPSLEEVKKDLVKKIRSFLSSCQEKLLDSAYFMTFFDVIKCPYLTNEFKNEIVDMGGFAKVPTVQEIDKIRTYIENHNWFFDWSVQFDLSKKLRKREYITPYE